ncbi:MAG: BON domain-containing protein [Proteobacteria bacterium]|nr:BON domain-containing protein [Pseudomonadota bacterium]
MIKKSFIHLTFMFLALLISSGCSVQSSIRKGIETVYKTSVDERPLRHILNDKKLTGLMMAKLLEDDVTRLMDVSAVCYFGYPFVVGQCSTLDEAQRIMDIAQEVTGKPAVPYLLKKGEEEDCNPAINLEVAYETMARLTADKKIFATNVTVKSVQCQVVLLGVLGSKESILAAIEHAKSVSGTKKVQSFLVSTDTGRSWDAVFESIGKMATDSEKEPLMNEGHTQDKQIKQDNTGKQDNPDKQDNPNKLDNPDKQDNPNKQIIGTE